MKICLDRFDSKSFTKAVAAGNQILIMPILTFLELARPGCSLEKTLSVLFGNGTAFSLPKLYLESDNIKATTQGLFEFPRVQKRVVDHDGRHRARYLLDLGYTHMPVVCIGDILGATHLRSEDGTRVFPISLQ